MIDAFAKLAAEVRSLHVGYVEDLCAAWVLKFGTMPCVVIHGNRTYLTAVEPAEPAGIDVQQLALKRFDPGLWYSAEPESAEVATIMHEHEPNVTVMVRRREP